MAVLDNPIAIRKIAMDLLAMREHSHVELKRKLLRKGATPELIDAVLNKLTQDKLLCEQRYLEVFIRSRANNGYGPIRIQQELLQKGLTHAAIQQVLQNSDYDWDEKLKELWQRKFGHYPKDPKEKAKQGRFLIYRGFSMDKVTKLLNKRELY